MAHWAIYSTASGALYNIADAPPNLAELAEKGLGASFFGEDRPDLSALEWCPRRLSFVVSQDNAAFDVLRADLANLRLDFQALANRIEALRGLDKQLFKSLNETDDNLADLAQSVNDRMAVARETVSKLNASVNEAARGWRDDSAALKARISAIEEWMAEPEEVPQGWLSRLRARVSGG
jgi:uncharacterized protein YhaN